MYIYIYRLCLYICLIVVIVIAMFTLHVMPPARSILAASRLGSPRRVAVLFRFVFGPVASPRLASHRVT